MNSISKIVIPFLYDANNRYFYGFTSVVSLASVGT